MRLFRREQQVRTRSSFQVLVQGKKARVGRRNLGLREPVLVASFEGWNDAGESASYASRYLERVWGAVPFGEIDGEEFFDYTETRPETVIADNGERRIAWPATKLFLASAPNHAQDVVLLRSPEPQLHWRAYCEVLIEVMQRIGISKVVLLGAYLSEVTHRRPVAVSLTSAGVRLSESTGVQSTPYEGPTGIVGVLSAALDVAGITSVSAWASVPCYSFPVSQKAALALVEMAALQVGRDIDLAELKVEADEYEMRMNELISEDENIAAYVARIEEMEDAVGTEVSAEDLTDEIERYLRGRRSG